MGEEKPFNGYEYHVRKRAFWTPLGLAVLTSAFGVSSFFMLLPPIQSEDASRLAWVLDWFIHFESDQLIQYKFSNAHVSSAFTLIALVVIGIVMLRFSHKDNVAFMEANPFIDLTFTPEEIREARRVQRRFILAGIAVIVAAIALALAIHETGQHKIANGFGFCISAVGVWLVAHGVLGDRVAQSLLYNYESLQHTSLYRIEQYYRGPERDVVLAAKRRAMRAQSVNRVLLTAGALGSMACYFLPTLETPLWWVPLAVALALCGLVINRAVHWVVGQVRASEDLQAFRDRVIHGKAQGGRGGGAPESEEAKLAAFEATENAFAEAVAAAQDAIPESDDGETADRG